MRWRSSLFFVTNAVYGHQRSPVFASAISAAFCSRPCRNIRTPRRPSGISSQLPTTIRFFSTAAIRERGPSRPIQEEDRSHVCLWVQLESWLRYLHPVETSSDHGPLLTAPENDKQKTTIAHAGPCSATTVKLKGITCGISR